MKRMMKNIINVILGALLLALISCGGIGGGLGGNSDSDEKAYIGFSADVARFVVASQKLAEADVCKVELVAEKVLADGKTENVKIEGAEWKSLADLRKATLEFYKGTYNFYLNLYAETEIYEDGAYHLKLVQTAKIENKEIVAGKNTLTFNSNYVDTGDLAVGWACSIADGKVCPANYAIGTLYNIDDPKNVKNITLWNWDDGEKKTRNFAVVEKDLDNGFYVLDVAFYDKQIVYPGNEARYEGANLLATKHAVVAVNGFQTYKAFEIDFDEIAREGDAYPMEKEYQLDISVDSALIGSNFNHIFADLRYFPSNSKYLSQLKNLVAEENCIPADGGRKLLKNSEGFLDLADKSKWLGNFDNIVDETDAEDAKRKISITNNTLTMTRTVKVTPGLDGKGFFFLTILYENRDIPGYAIDTFALPADEIELKEGQINRIVLSSYERYTKAPAGGEITWEGMDAEIYVNNGATNKRLFLNDNYFYATVIKKGGDPNDYLSWLDATDWTAKIYYGGKDINTFAPDGHPFYSINETSDQIPIDYNNPDAGVKDIHSGDLFVGFPQDISLGLEYDQTPLETGGTYQLLISCKVNGITISKTYDISFENRTSMVFSIRESSYLAGGIANRMNNLDEKLQGLVSPVYIEFGGDMAESSANEDFKTVCDKLNTIKLPIEANFSHVGNVTEISEGAFSGSNLEKIWLPLGTESINSEAFESLGMDGLSNLTTLYLPKTLTKFTITEGQQENINPFSNCLAIQKFVIYDQIQAEGTSIFETDEKQFSDSSYHTLLNGALLIGSTEVGDIDYTKTLIAASYNSLDKEYHGVIDFTQEPLSKLDAIYGSAISIRNGYMQEHIPVVKIGQKIPHFYAGPFGRGIENLYLIRNFIKTDEDSLTEMQNYVKELPLCFEIENLVIEGTINLPDGDSIDESVFKNLANYEFRENEDSDPYEINAVKHGIKIYNPAGGCESIIGKYQFAEFNRISELDLNNIKIIKDYAFYETGSNCNVIIGEDVKAIGKDAFASASINSINIKDESNWYFTTVKSAWESAIETGLPEGGDDGWEKIEATEDKSVSEIIKEMLLEEDTDNRKYLYKNN